MEPPGGGLSTQGLGKSIGSTAIVVNGTGDQMAHAPDATLSINLDYKKSFSAGTLELNATGYYSGRIYFDNYQGVSQAPYATLNLQASWRPAGSRFVFEAWRKNVTNTLYLQGVYEQLGSQNSAYYGDPATYGVAVKYSF